MLLCCETEGNYVSTASGTTPGLRVICGMPFKLTRGSAVCMQRVAEGGTPSDLRRGLEASAHETEPVGSAFVWQ